MFCAFRCRPVARPCRAAAAMATSDRVLYWGSGSTPCWRVQIALAEKELPYESKLLQFSKSAHSHRLRDVAGLSSVLRAGCWPSYPHTAGVSSPAIRRAR